MRETARPLAAVGPALDVPVIGLADLLHRIRHAVAIAVAEGWPEGRIECFAVDLRRNCPRAVEPVQRVQHGVAPPTGMDAGRCVHRKLCFVPAGNEQLVPLHMTGQIMHQQRKIMALIVECNEEVIGHRHRLFAGKVLVEAAFANVGHVRLARRTAERIVGRQLRDEGRRRACRIAGIGQFQPIGRPDLTGADGACFHRCNSRLKTTLAETRSQPFRRHVGKGRNRISH